MKLANWHLTNNISLKATSELLTILQHCHPDLPKDARTLIEKKSAQEVASMGNGLFSYFGLIDIAKDYILNNPFVLNIDLILNFDALPVFRSKESSFWPILARFRNCKQVFIIGVYFGDSKPPLHPYLNQLIMDLQHFYSTGTMVNNTFYKLVVKVVCNSLISHET